MKNTISRILAGAIVAAGTMFAGAFNDVNVTLPHDVVIGSSTLRAGAYTLSPVAMSDGIDYFIVRGKGTAPVILPAQKTEGDTATKTSVTLSEADGVWHFDKLSIEGESAGFELGK
jgi:hypothetical protein